MPAQITITAANAADLVTAGFSTIDIFHSLDKGGTYNEATASTPQAAFLETVAANTKFRLGGKLLVVAVNGVEQPSISFSSLLDYWTPSQVVTRINEVVPLLATTSSSKVKLTSPTTGRASSVEIVYCDAEDFGLLPGTKAYGKNQRLQLSGVVFIYTFIDQAGSKDDRYKYRFSDDGADPASQLSDRMLGVDPPLSSVTKSIAVAKFLNVDARPVKTRIVVSPSGSYPESISGYIVGSTQPIIVDSDDDGFLQIPLVSGAHVRVAIEGTTFVRDIIVPATPTFDLLAAMAAVPDPFTVQQTPPLLVRRSI